MVSGFRKAGIYPYSREVIDKTKYDPESYARYLNSKKQQPQENNELEPEETNELPTEDLNHSEVRNNDKLIDSTDSPYELVVNTSFENLLLQTVKQNSPGQQKKGKKLPLKQK